MLEILDTVVLQEFVSHPVMERLNEPVMPGLAWWDECLDCLTLGCPLRECLMVCVWVPNLHEETDQNDYCGTTRPG